MTIEERNNKLKYFITCLKCEVSGNCCDYNCPAQYEAGNMGEIIENLEAMSKVLEQETMKANDFRKLYSRMELCVNLVHDIALICKEANYPEDLEDIYDLLTNNGIDFKNLEDNNRWLKEHD